MELIIAIVSICIFIALLSFSILKIWLPGYMVREMEQYQNKLLERQFEEIDNTYREMRGWRHDYKNHMQVLKIYVENRQWENARDYIVQMNEDLESIDHVIKTGNIMADAIVNSKVSLAKKKDIKLDVTAKIPKEIPMTDVEFCVVFGNIMDNAIEACEKLASKENKFIRVYIGVFKKQFYMSLGESIYTEFYGGEYTLFRYNDSCNGCMLQYCRYAPVENRFDCRCYRCDYECV